MATQGEIVVPGEIVEPGFPATARVASAHAAAVAAAAAAAAGASGTETYELVVELTRENEMLGIGVTYGDKSGRCIVVIEPAARRRSDLHYGDQIVSVDGSPLAGRRITDAVVPKPTHRLVVRYTRTSSEAVSPRRVRARKVHSQGGGV